jgi:hypothetical protein
MLQFERETRFLASVQAAVAALLEVVEARGHLRDVGLRGRQAERLFGERLAQEEEVSDCS